MSINKDLVAGFKHVTAQLSLTQKQVQEQQQRLAAMQAALIAVRAAIEPEGGEGAAPARWGGAAQRQAQAGARTGAAGARGRDAAGVSRPSASTPTLPWAPSHCPALLANAGLDDTVIPCGNWHIEGCYAAFSLCLAAHPSHQRSSNLAPQVATCQSSTWPS
jgi:hypothetical protein